MSNFNRHHCCHNNNVSDINTDYKDEAYEDSSPCSNLCQTQEMNCECGFDMDSESVFPSNPMLAQSYVPIQRMKKVFTPDVGLKMGTIFPELVSPYCPGQSIEEIEYLRNTNSIGEGCNR
mgnify:CR=1 FL=1